jgi:hypothetical protein
MQLCGYLRVSRSFADALNELICVALSACPQDRIAVHNGGNVRPSRRGPITQCERKHPVDEFAAASL